MRAVYYREPNGDYLMTFGAGSEPALLECRAAAIEGLESSVCTTQIHKDILARCKRVRRADVPKAWREGF